MKNLGGTRGQIDLGSYSERGSSGIQGRSGKTSLCEALLFSGRATTRLGKVEEHSTVFDYEPEEHKHHGSVQMALAHVNWQDHKINLLDAAGDGNFMAETHNALFIAETALWVVSASEGVERDVARLLAFARGKAGAVVVNKLHRERADYWEVLRDLQAHFATSCVPITIPLNSEAQFTGVINLLDMHAHVYAPQSQESPKIIDIPVEFLDVAKKSRQQLVEEMVSNDEKLMATYLAKGDLAGDNLRVGLRRAIAAGVLYPVFACDALQNVGVTELLDEMVELFPSPLDVKTFSAEVEGKWTELPRQTEGDFVAVVFKTIVDQHTGKISLFKVLSGNALKDLHVEGRHSERLSNLLTVMGKKTEHVNEVITGDLAAAGKLKEALTGDTLYTGTRKIKVYLPDLLPPQISYRLLPKHPGEEDKLANAIHKLRDEDPSVTVSHDPLSKEMVISGYGATHLDITLERLERRFGVQADKALPHVPYRETFKQAVQNVEGKHKKQSGGHGQFAVCHINVKPLARGEGYRFINSIVGGAIPKQYIPAVDKGIQEAMEHGVVAGYPVTDLEVDLIDGKFHDVDSSELAFKLAGQKAFRSAAAAAGIALLEPVMQVDIEIPEPALGEVLGDVSSRRGHVLGMETNDGLSKIKAQVPMAEMLSYAPKLKSMTHGQGLFTMSLGHYELVPPNWVGQIIKDSPRKPMQEE
jgi:elongation factor G